MPEKIEELVRAALAAAQEAGDLSAFELDDCAIERPADTSHGEWTSTMALKSAKLAHCAPRKIAEAIVAHMPRGSRDRERLRSQAPVSSTSTSPLPSRMPSLARLARRAWTSLSPTSVVA